MLNTLMQMDGISGMETPIREYLKQTLTDVCDTLYEDGMGNLIAKKKGNRTGAPTLLAVHMDEPGVIVTRITEEGYLGFAVVGRIKTEQLLYRRVNLGGVSGVIALKAVHLTSKEEREKPVTADALLIDIGADTKEEAENRITVGDYGILEGRPSRMGESLVKGRAAAGRLGCAVGAALLRETPACDLEVVFACQRELHARGLLTALSGCDATRAIVIDGYEGDSLSLDGENSQLKQEIERSAERQKIRLVRRKSEFPQMKVLAESGRIREAVALEIPVKNPQSPAELVDLHDMEEMQRLLMDFFKEETL